MILGKAEINKILIEDAIANRRQSIRTKPHGDETWRFIVLFRKCQYHDKKREKSIINRFLFSINYFFYHRLSVRLGFSIPYKTQIGPGLSIPHYGSIVISDKAQI